MYFWGKRVKRTIPPKVYVLPPQKERISTLLNNIKNLMEKMGWSAEQSMDVLDISENDRKTLLQLLK